MRSTTPVGMSENLAGLVLLSSILLGSTTLQAQQWNPEIENLQVLPADTPAREVIGLMRDVTMALGVRCQYCHVGEEGQPLSEFDMPSDAKATKTRAREMMRMTKAINSQHLDKLQGDRSGLQVTCDTCHRGAARPEPLKDLMVRTVEEQGVEAALEKYDEVREQYYGSGTFDFTDRSLVMAAEQLAAAEKLDEAIQLLELNRQYHPDSRWNSGTLAGAYEKAGRKDDALAFWKELLEESPGNPRILQQIERLEGQ